MDGLKIEVPTEAIEQSIQESIGQVLINWLEDKERPPIVKPYMSYEETADLLGVTEATIKRWVRCEGLKIIDLGHKIKRIDYKDLTEFLAVKKAVSRLK